MIVILSYRKDSTRGFLQQEGLKIQLSSMLTKGRLPYCREYVTLSVRIQGQRRGTGKAGLFLNAGADDRMIKEKDNTDEQSFDCGRRGGWYAGFCLCRKAGA
jgi:hypothetical protein